MINKTLEIFNTFQKPHNRVKLSAYEFAKQLNGVMYADATHLINSAVNGNIVATQIILKILDDNYDETTQKMFKKIKKKW